MGEMTLEVMVEVMMEVRAEVMEEVIVAMEVLLPEAPECWVTFLCFSSILSSPPSPSPSPPSSHSSPFPLSGIPVQRKHDWVDD